MKYYFDEHLSAKTAAILRRAGLDVLTTEEAGRKGRSDEEQLLFAAKEGRCLVTANCTDFRPFSSSFAERGLAHQGVLCLPSSMHPNQFALVAAAILAYDSAQPDGIPAYMLDYLRHVAG